MKTKHLPEHEVIDNFVAAMAAAGLQCTDKIVGDGELHRFNVEGDAKVTKNGWYVLFMDGIPAGEFGCWKRGVTMSWCAKCDTELTAVEMAEVKARIEQARHERAERERMKHEASAAEAMRIWDAAHDVDEHAYLIRKNVKSYGLRVGQWLTGVQALLVPVMNTQGSIVSLQAIFDNVNPLIGRDKDFLAGGKKSGCFFQIGMPPIGAQTIVLCEGYATGASIHEATGFFTVVAFDSGNLKPVANELRRRWAQATIIIAADNDRWTFQPVENVGVTYARRVAEAIPARVFVAVPEFSSLESKPTDFNDLARLDGIEEVRKQILAALPQPETPANDNDQDGHRVPLDSAVAPFGFPHVSDKGQPLNTVENLNYLMTEYGITARYNQIKKQVDVELPNRHFTADNRANCSLAELTSICARNRMPQSLLADYVKLIADRNSFNPVRDWIESKEWDGTKRIGQLLDTVKTASEHADLKNRLMYRWMLSAVASVYMPVGFESHGCLVFTGAQGAGKTTWFRRLVPANLGLVLVGAMLDPNNKDTVTNAVSHWIVELGELDATFRKADIARLKSFITLPVDKLRRPYDRIDSEYQRRTVFCASVNEDKYLVDDTGNRRWWTVPVVAVDYMHTLDMQQVWAEIATHHLAGEQHHLTPEESEQLNALNASHEAVDPVEESIVAAFDWSNKIAAGMGRPMTATQVLLEIGYDKPNKIAATHASKILKKLTGGEPTKTATGRFFNMPASTKRQRFGHDDESRPF
jgi:putative DNA primase/helicase